MTVTERPRDQRESRVPRHPSNRSLVEKMGEWGWRIVKQGSKRWVLEAPYGDGRVEVMPPALHEANPTSVFLDVYRLTSAGDPELFWRGPSRLAIDMLNEHLLAKKKEKQAREAAEREKQAAVAAERAAAAPAPPTSVSNLRPVVVPSATPTPEPTPEPTPTVVFVTRPYTKGRTSSVLDAVNASPRAMTIRQVASRIGLDVSDPGEHRRLIQALSGLAREGKITRPAKGVYRRLATYAEAVTPAAPAAPELQPAPQEVAVPTSQPVEAPPAPAAAESVDDVIEAVLDLLLPNGFQAKHLRVIAPWIEATKKMVEVVTG